MIHCCIKLRICFYICMCARAHTHIHMRARVRVPGVYTEYLCCHIVKAYAVYLYIIDIWIYKKKNYDLH